jgi:hypothetical protein
MDFRQRFAKMEVLEWFDRQERSYRLAILCTHWIRGTARYKPSASEEAKGLQMAVRGRFISYADLAAGLEQQHSRDVLASDFALTQLYALICSPFEILRDYCEDYDKLHPTRFLLKEMKDAAWYEFTRIIRNALSHNFHFHFNEHDKKMMPISWNSITISKEMEGHPITYESLWHKSGYELFLEMREFANVLPETAIPRQC